MADKINLYPIEECIKSADPLIAKGCMIYQQFLCEHCGTKQTMTEPNGFYLSGTCEECGKDTDIQKHGCNYMVTASAEGAKEALLKELGATKMTEQAFMIVGKDENGCEILMEVAEKDRAVPALFGSPEEAEQMLKSYARHLRADVQTRIVSITKEEMGEMIERNNGDAGKIADELWIKTEKAN